MTGSGGNHNNEGPDDLAHLPRTGPWAGDLWLAIDYGLTATQFAYYTPDELDRALRVEPFTGAMADTVREVQAITKLYRITRIGLVPSAFSKAFLSFAREWLPNLEDMAQRTFAIPVFTAAQTARIHELIRDQLDRQSADKRAKLRTVIERVGAALRAPAPVHSQRERLRFLLSIRPGETEAEAQARLATIAAAEAVADREAQVREATETLRDLGLVGVSLDEAVSLVAEAAPGLGKPDLDRLARSLTDLPWGTLRSVPDAEERSRG